MKLSEQAAKLEEENERIKHLAGELLATLSLDHNRKTFAEFDSWVMQKAGPLAISFQVMCANFSDLLRELVKGEAGKPPTLEDGPILVRDSPTEWWRLTHIKNGKLSGGWIFGEFPLERLQCEGTEYRRPEPWEVDYIERTGNGKYLYVLNDGTKKAGE